MTSIAVHGHHWCCRRSTKSLFQARSVLEGTVLKPNMVVPGKKSGKRASVDEVAKRPCGAQAHCSGGASGIAFLSGASRTRTRPPTRCHNKTGRCLEGDLSYGRALQAAPQKRVGKAENVAAAQRAFSHRAHMNGLATLGHWKADLEKKAA